MQSFCHFISDISAPRSVFSKACGMLVDIFFISVLKVSGRLT